MAFNRYHNITGSTGVDIELIAPRSNASEIKSIVITNTHVTADATVSLFIQDSPTGASTRTFYILSTVAIPSDTSLLLNDSSIFKYGDTYGLYGTVGSSDTVDVMINI